MWRSRTKTACLIIRFQRICRDCLCKDRFDTKAAQHRSTNNLVPHSHSSRHVHTCHSCWSQNPLDHTLLPRHRAAPGAAAACACATRQQGIAAAVESLAASLGPTQQALRRMQPPPQGGATPASVALDVARRLEADGMLLLASHPRPPAPPSSEVRSEALDVARRPEVDGMRLGGGILVLPPHLDCLVRFSRCQPRARPGEHSARSVRRCLLQAIRHDPAAKSAPHGPPLPPASSRPTAHSRNKSAASLLHTGVTLCVHRRHETTSVLQPQTTTQAEVRRCAASALVEGQREDAGLRLQRPRLYWRRVLLEAVAALPVVCPAARSCTTEGQTMCYSQTGGQSRYAYNGVSHCRANMGISWAALTMSNCFSLMIPGAEEEEHRAA